MGDSVLAQSRREERKIGGAPGQERCMPSLEGRMGVCRVQVAAGVYRVQGPPVVGSRPPAQSFSGYPGG